MRIRHVFGSKCGGVSLTFYSSAHCSIQGYWEGVPPSGSPRQRAVWGRAPGSQCAVHLTCATNDELLDSAESMATMHAYTPSDVEHSVQLSTSMKG